MLPPSQLATLSTSERVDFGAAAALLRLPALPEQSYLIFISFALACSLVRFSLEPLARTSTDWLRCVCAGRLCCATRDSTVLPLASERVVWALAFAAHNELETHSGCFFVRFSRSFARSLASLPVVQWPPKNHSSARSMLTHSEGNNLLLLSLSNSSALSMGLGRTAAAARWRNANLGAAVPAPMLQRLAAQLDSQSGRVYSICAQSQQPRCAR